MNTTPASNGTKPTIAQAQIIVFALIAGITLFAVIAYVLGPVGGAGDELLEGVEPTGSAIPMFGTIVAFQGTMAIAAAFFIRGVLAQRVKPRRAEALEEVRGDIMPAELLTATIVACAIVESAGLLGCIGCLLESEVLYLAAPMVAVALMAFWLPSRSGLENWLEGLS